MRYVCGPFKGPASEKLISTGPVKNGEQVFIRSTGGEAGGISRSNTKMGCSRLALAETAWKGRRS
jgi:hypothetical protein